MVSNRVKIKKYLGLKRLGFLELLFAFTPILWSYSLFELPLSLVIWLMMLVIVVYKGYKIRIDTYKPLLVFSIYWLIHSFIIVFIDDIMNLNNIIAQVVYFVAIFSLFPILDYEKLKDSLNFVSIIAIMGLLYQWMEIYISGGTHPIEIPGLDMSLERMEKYSLRPSSFFMEPAAYVNFMLAPLALALMDRKIIWAIVLILSIFFTSSTTGLIISFIMLGVWGLMQNKKKLLIPVTLIFLGLFYSLTHFSIFETGLEKIQSTNIETNVRLTQGQYIVGTMELSEYVIGVPYGSPYRYCKSGRAPMVVYYGENVFMPTFWQILLLYGIIGLVLYLFIYYDIYKRCKQLLPLLVCLVATMFSGGVNISSGFVFILIFMLVVSKEYRRRNVA